MIDSSAGLAFLIPQETIGSSSAWGAISTGAPKAARWLARHLPG
jgi:hypothetical protein